MYNKVILNISFKQKRELLNTEKIGEFVSKVNEYFDEHKIVSGATFFRNIKQNLFLTLDDESIQLTKEDVSNISDVNQLSMICFSTLKEVFGPQQKPIKISLMAHCSYSSGKRIISKLTSIPKEMLILGDEIKLEAVGLTLKKGDINYNLFIASPKKGLDIIISYHEKIENESLLKEILTNVGNAIETDIIPSIEQLTKNYESKEVK
jgi:hypothetical protein